MQIKFTDFATDATSKMGYDWYIASARASDYGAPTFRLHL